MPDITKEFIRNIPLEKYLKNAENRKIVVWGNGKIGEKVLDVLQEKGYSVSYVVDKKQDISYTKQSISGTELKHPDCLRSETAKVYCIVAIRQYHPEIEEYLNEIGYEEISDYLFLFHKPTIVEYEQPYMDLYNNIIVGKVGTVVSITAYNSKLELYANVNSDFGIYVCDSDFGIGEDVVFDCSYKEGTDRSIYCYKNSKIQLGKNVCIPYTFWVECCNNSSIYIDKEVILKDKCTMLCFEKSDIQLGAGGHYGVGFSMSCRNNSQICVGKYLNWTMGGGIYCLNNSRIVIGDKFYVGKDSIITCRRQSSLIIGDDCSVQWFFICASEYEGTVVIKDRFMASYNVSIFNNDTHPIFFFVKAKQINRDRKIIISEHVWAGIKSTILSGAEIGQSCIIGANSVITKKFPNNCTLGGIPARILNKNMTWDVREEDISNVDQKYNCLTEEEEESVNV